MKFNFVGYRTLKTGIGASAAIIICQQLGLKYAVAAGVITILSIQKTKKKSILLALERMFSSVIGLAIASVVFMIGGFNAVDFGIFLILFIPIAVKLKVDEGIVLSSVLVTHLLTEKTVNLSILSNEIGLVAVGVFVALVLNLYIPSMESEIRKDQKCIDDKFKYILHKMSEALRNNYASIEEVEAFSELKNKIKEAREKAYINLDNNFNDEGRYYLEYIEMRRMQFSILERMKIHFKRFYMTYEQNTIMADFFEEVANNTYELNTAEGLLKELQELREVFKDMKLPESRDEFENRAMLYQLLNDLEEVLQIKNDFKRNF